MEGGKVGIVELTSSSSSSASPEASSQGSPRPTYLAMVLEAVLALDDRRGSSRQSIVKYIAYQFGLDAKKSGGRVNQALKKALEMGILRQTSGSGVVGSFKIGNMDVPPGTVARKLLGKPSFVKNMPATRAKAKGAAAKAAVKSAAAKGAAKAVARKRGAKGASSKTKKSPVKKTATKASAKKTATKAPTKKADKKAPAKRAAKKLQEKKAAKESPAKKAKSMAKKPVPKKAKKP
ncbi:late histone H1-like [Penaeus chinensis]|uniref:late histone H1-like n=1 Tax=Penaeus chinensis TaxID=139456 RepID=UPI001FB81BF9|nr:late histone H1-like [Penaeus chinensis]